MATLRAGIFACSAAEHIALAVLLPRAIADSLSLSTPVRGALKLRLDRRSRLALGQMQLSSS